MKHHLLFLFCRLYFANAQPGTEVYLLDLSSDTPTPINISQNLGYDNQPSFWDDESLLYTSTRAGQTDIVRYSLTAQNKEWLCNSPQGSEYSPLRIPESETFSAIRLDTTGLQRLYRYNLQGNNQLLFPPLKIGYHRWISSSEALCTVLVENRMDLVLASVSKSSKIIDKQVGRSLHAIPTTQLFSFVKPLEGQSILHSYDPISEEMKTLLTLPKGVQDVAWLPTGLLLFGQGNTLYRWDPTTSTTPEQWISLPGIRNISRLAVSPNGQLLALVGDE